MKFPFIVAAFVLVTACNKDNSSDGPTPTISIADISAFEGNSGTTNFEFIAKLSTATNQTVSLDYTVLDGTAKAGEDFTAVNKQTLTFQPGEVEKKITVVVIADDIREPDETFQLAIGNISHATAGSSVATATILNDDTKIVFTNAGYDAPSSYAGYTRIFSDEFDGTALNTANWSFQNGNGCPSLCGWGNNELEYYNSNNLFFQDGKMIIEARKEASNGSNYTSAKIVSTGKKTFKFGRIDIRAKLPKGKGIWPALWMMPESSVYGTWPKSGEIDIMEMLGHEPNKVYGTLHFGPGPGSTQIGKNYTLASGSFYDEFHVFSLEWKQDEIKWLIDGNVYGTATKTDVGANTYPFNEQFYFIFNVAVGGNWPGSPDATTTFPQWMIVDYVRVYQ